jgi:hypothetical protein
MINNLFFFYYLNVFMILFILKENLREKKCLKFFVYFDKSLINYSKIL